jgi:hypothetical protein
LESASYRKADEDLDFLNRYDLRGVRLQIDYLKAELSLEQHSIRHTIVVFGGTRIREPRRSRKSKGCAQLKQPTYEHGRGTSA